MPADLSLDLSATRAGACHHPDTPPVAATESGGPPTSPGVLEGPHKYGYEVVQGFFVQNGPQPKQFEFEELVTKAFGLIDKSPERWQNFRASIAKLQAEAPSHVQYKVFFLGRHGQGWHNFGALKYGTEEWEEKWTTQTTDGEITWGPDPELTPLGHQQTLAIRKAWEAEAPLGAPIGGHEMHWFVSPLQRTCQTLLNSWGDLLAGTPESWEDWREIYGSHTCDKRSPKSVAAKRFPMVNFDPEMTEEDELWLPDDRETNAHMQIRMRRAMDRVFDGAAPETFVSVTGHAAIFRNLLAVLGHQPYPLTTGEMIPVVVKATRLPQPFGI